MDEYCKLRIYNTVLCRQTPQTLEQDSYKNVASERIRLHKSCYKNGWSRNSIPLQQHYKTALFQVLVVANAVKLYVMSLWTFPKTLCYSVFKHSFEFMALIYVIVTCKHFSCISHFIHNYVNITKVEFQKTIYYWVYNIGVLF